MVYDARYMIRNWLNAKIVNANLTKDDDATQVTFITHYSNPPYPLMRVFKGTKNVDLAYGVGKPASTPLMGAATAPWGYLEEVPIEITCIKKQGIDGNKLLWKGEVELRRIAESYPEGSRLNLGESRDITSSGSTTIYGVKVVASYRRGVT